jgi:hypothetical protein
MMVEHVTLAAVSERTRTRRLAPAAALLVALLGCGEEQFFDVVLQEPQGTDCPAHNDFNGYAVLVWQGDNDFVGCVEDQCAVIGQSARECLAEVETDALEPGRSARIKVMLFDGPPNLPPVWCGDGVSPELDFDTARVDVGLKCADTCDNLPCQPETCLTERNALCER